MISSKRQKRSIHAMKQKCRFIINLFTAFMPFAAWLMMFGGPSGVLSSHGVQSLRYFTVLSNLFEGAASIVWLIFAVRSKKPSHIAEALKFIACLSVFLTFATVVVYLGPLFGYSGMYQGVNFWFHLIIPLASILEILLFMRETISFFEASCSVIPVVIYGCFYLGNILVNGRGDETHWNDFYGFVTWGIPVGIIIFAVICTIVFLTAMIFRRIVCRIEK